MTQRHFVVVGGSHGIGLGIVERLVARGDGVTVVSRTSEHLARLGNVTHVEVDVMTGNLAPEQLPPSIAGFVYCPGSINLGSIRSLTQEAMVDDYRLNVIGAVNCIQAALPALKNSESSAIVLFSTVAVAQGLPLHASVAACKGAVEGLARTLAAELAPKVRVNCIAPALTDTRLAEKFLSSDEKRNAMNQRYPLRRIGQVDDIASAACFLLGSDSSWMTGQVLGVDGGMSTLRV